MKLSGVTEAGTEPAPDRQGHLISTATVQRVLREPLMHPEESIAWAPNTRSLTAAVGTPLGFLAGIVCSIWREPTSSHTRPSTRLGAAIASYHRRYR